MGPACEVSLPRSSPVHRRNRRSHDREPAARIAPNEYRAQRILTPPSRRRTWWPPIVRPRGKFGFAHAAGDWRDVINNPDIGGLDITTPNNMHFEVAMAALRAGKCVYREKPPAVTLADAEALAGTAGRAGAATMLAFNNIKTPAALLARRLIDRGEIGRLTRFRGWFDQGFFNDPELPCSRRCSREQAGSGALGDLGSHVISVAQFLMGPAWRASPCRRGTGSSSRS
ncbi:MAG: Gfo/Idh/MocA family protein [Acetobacteraceae bacterium]